MGFLSRWAGVIAGLAGVSLNQEHDDARCRPHPRNTPGPFYVLDGCCTACGVPLDEAPELFAYDDHQHCYFKRQPANAEELNGALRAAWAAELACIRYAGDDPDTLQRFAEAGVPELCDGAALQQLRPILRNHVTFDAVDPAHATSTAADLAASFRQYLCLPTELGFDTCCTTTIVEGTTVSFSYAWADEFHRIEFTDLGQSESRWLVRHSPVEKVGSRSVSKTVDDWLKAEGRFCSIRWYTEEGWNGEKQWRDTPW